MISSWKIVQRLGLLLLGSFEVVVEISISGVEEKASHSEGALTLWEAQGAHLRVLRGSRTFQTVISFLSRKLTPGYIIISTCFGYLCTFTCYLFLAKLYCAHLD
jgi:hypothetical protein